jgi:hypothetical protein
VFHHVEKSLLSVQGVLNVSVGSVGFLGNIMAIVVLLLVSVSIFTECTYVLYISDTSNCLILFDCFNGRAFFW